MYGMIVISMSGFLLLSTVTFFGWFGPLLVLSVFLAGAALAGVISISIRRRLREIANPFRELRRLDESVIRLRSTVISGRG